MPSSVSLLEFGRFHASRLAFQQSRPASPVLVITALAASAIVPFLFVTFFVIPMMGQVAVGQSLLLTELYRHFCRLFLFMAPAIVGAVFLLGALFLSIEAVRNNLEVPLVLVAAIGILVCSVSCIFLRTRIWRIRGGIYPL